MLWFVGFVLVVFNLVNRHGTERGEGKIVFPFSQVQNIERVESFQVGCLLPVHHAFFVLFECVAFLGAMLLLCSTMVSSLAFGAS